MVSAVGVVGVVLVAVVVATDPRDLSKSLQSHPGLSLQVVSWALNMVPPLKGSDVWAPSLYSVYTGYIRGGPYYGAMELPGVEKAGARSMGLRLKVEGLTVAPKSLPWCDTRRVATQQEKRKRPGPSSVWHTTPSLSRHHTLSGEFMRFRAWGGWRCPKPLKKYHKTKQSS